MDVHITLDMAAVQLRMMVYLYFTGVPSPFIAIFALNGSIGAPSPFFLPPTDQYYQ